MTAQRLDVLLAARGLARSRSAAAAAIGDGRVRVDGRTVLRPGTRVDEAAAVEVLPGDGWVGRAAGKLDAALDGFGIDVRGRLALDLGASTGGFTQVLRDRGAARVVAVDVGHGQLVPELRDDPRVLVVEGQNARDLDRARFAAITGDPALPQVVVADLSFISLVLVLPAIAALAGCDTDVVLLVKPQFEVGRERIRDGVVRDDGDRADAVREVLAAGWAHGLGTAGVAASSVVGARGNREVLVHLHVSRGSDPAEWSGSVERVVRSSTEEPA